MPTKIIDLDELIAAPKRVSIQGVTYTLPGELPVPLYLKLKSTEEPVADGDEENDRVEELNGLLLELFRVHQPDLEELPLGLTQMFTVIPRVYGAANILEEEDDEGDANPNLPATRARTGKGSTQSRSRPRSRS